MSDLLLCMSQGIVAGGLASRVLGQQHFIRDWRNPKSDEMMSNLIPVVLRVPKIQTANDTLQQHIARKRFYFSFSALRLTTEDITRRAS